MISPEYCRQMARYNRWQNKQLGAAMETLSAVELRKDRGAFFGSIFRTVNHLLWGDTLWISRFDGGPGPAESDLSKTDTTDITATLTAWSAARFDLDARFAAWGETLRDTDLRGDLSWYSGAVGRDISKPRSLCVLQMFNHQTHHRGQVHAMLTAAGVPGYATDIPFMPE